MKKNPKNFCAIGKQPDTVNLFLCAICQLSIAQQHKHMNILEKQIKALIQLKKTAHETKCIKWQCRPPEQTHKQNDVFFVLTVRGLIKSLAQFKIG